MNSQNDFAIKVLGIILLLNFILLIILFFMNLANRSKLNKMRRKYNKFMEGIGEKNMEQLLETCIDRIEEVRAKSKDVQTKINFLERNQMQCIQKIGVVRYNAFDNVGSDLSFAIALLDAADNGVVISGIYTRESTSTYAKALEAGKSKHTLSVEEIQAIDRAKKMFGERLYTE